MTSKSHLRKVIIEKRKLLDLDYRSKISNEIIEKLVKINQLKEAKYIGIYMPILGEIDIRNIVNFFPEKVFAAPKIIGDDMQFIQIKKDSNFTKSNFNIDEPVDGKDISHLLNVILVPCLGINQTNHRLGYGKGFFDKFFKKYDKSYKIGIIYKDEEIDFQVEDHDIALDCYMKG